MRARIPVRRPDSERPSDEATAAAPAARPAAVDRARHLAPRWGAVVLLALLAVPLVVVLIALRHPRWYPALDLAWTEMRVRDVWSSHPPLVGLAGRIGTAEHPGSHPGPFNFWAMWPLYQLFGGGAWGLQAASILLHTAAMGTSLLIAHRRAGPGLVVGMAAVLAALVHAYGPALLAEPWNPFLPLLWWIVFLLAVWSVLESDWAMLPVAVAAGSFGAQTHIPYAGLGVGVGLLTVGAIALGLRRTGRDRAERRRLLRWTAIGGAVGLVLWLPPVIDQITNPPGNLWIIWDYFRDPPEAAAGLGEGIEVLLNHLHPGRVLSGRLDIGQAAAPGVALLVVWGLSVVVAWRLGHRSLLRLHLVLAAALALGVLSVSRIFGVVWYYLTLWAWGLTALVMLAVGWTAVVAVQRWWARRDQRPPALARAGLAAAGVATVVVLTVASTVDATDADPPQPYVSRTLAGLVAPTVDGLRDSSVEGAGPEGRYLLTWVDPLALGSIGFGFLNELERSGVDVGVSPGFKNPVGGHRLREPDEATAVVHVSVGSDIDVWRAQPEAEEIAYVEPRTDAELAEFERLEALVIEELNANGLGQLAAKMRDTDFTALNGEPGVPAAARLRLKYMADLGLPTAVFVAPPELA